MRAYQNGYWLFNTDPTKVAGILARDARRDGCDQFVIDCIYAACANKGMTVANLMKGTKRVKTRAEIETEEALSEDFMW